MCLEIHHQIDRESNESSYYQHVKYVVSWKRKDDEKGYGFFACTGTGWLAVCELLLWLIMLVEKERQGEEKEIKGEGLE